MSLITLMSVIISHAYSYKSASRRFSFFFFFFLSIRSIGDNHDALSYKIPNVFRISEISVFFSLIIPPARSLRQTVVIFFFPFLCFSFFFLFFVLFFFLCKYNYNMATSKPATRNSSARRNSSSDVLTRCV